MRPEIEALIREAEALTASLTDEQASERPRKGGWSVTENLDHLTISTRKMIKAIDDAVERPGAARGGGPWKPSLAARLFLWILEPPVRLMKVKATPDYVPAPGRPKHVALGEFVAAHQEFAHKAEGDWAEFDANAVEVTSPFDAKVKYSLGTALAIVPAHGRRHIWQARQARR